jgi:DNA-binding transcriptional LysR family regulator
MMTMELRQLEHFVAIAEEHSFTKAAQRLNYVQSALSVSIKALERDLKVSLFERTTHRVVLTDAGAALLGPAQRTLAAAEEARDAAAAVQGVIRGTLRIGIMQAFSVLDIPQLLGQFHHEHPDVEIQLRPAVGGSAAMLEELRNGGFDVAFLSLLDPSASGVTVTRLAFEKLLLVSNQDLARPGTGAISLKSLSDANFVDFPVGWGIRSAVDRAFALKNLDRRVTVEVADVATCVRLVRAGLGVALLPRSLFAPYEPDLLARSITPALGWHVVMATPANRTPSAAAQAFTKLIGPKISSPLSFDQRSLKT